MKEITGKRIGLWLDHTKAQFVDISNGIPMLETMFPEEPPHLKFAGETGIGTKISETRSGNDEAHHHNHDQDMLHRYFKLLANRLKSYKHIYIIGPTTAGRELKNMLDADPHFRGCSITLESCDYLTENQLTALVKKHFEV